MHSKQYPLSDPLFRFKSTLILRIHRLSSGSLKNLCKSIQILIKTIFLKIKESARTQCAGRLYPNAESISCVCNSAYCDNFPVLQIPESGSALVFETSMDNEEIELNMNEPKSGHLNTKISAHSIQSYIWK